jgi:hypothetical protein
VNFRRPRHDTPRLPRCTELQIVQVAYNDFFYKLTEAWQAAQDKEQKQEERTKELSARSHLLDLREQQLEFKRLEQEKAFINNTNLTTEKQVHLNVGGKVFSTSHSTICSVPESMLCAMFSGRHELLTGMIITYSYFYLTS